MLRLICGEAGTGKSTCLREYIKSAAENGRKAVVFVPDQFSFETEKLIYRTVDRRYARNCTVTMFSRDAQRILRLYGRSKEYADDIAKRVLIKLVTEEACSDGSLAFYGAQVKKEGFPAFALGMISDMRLAGLSPSALSKKLAETDTITGRLLDKLNDISVIYRRYDELLTRNFSDRLDDIRAASELIRENDIYDGYDVFFDGFDNFSGNQLDFIKSLLAKAASVTVALTCTYGQKNEGAPDRRFEAVNRLAAKLAAFGGEPPEIVCTDRVFRRPDSLRVIEARDKWQEAEWICSEIRSLTDSGARCRDIAVISPDSGMTRILGSMMKRYEIPCFADIPEPLMTKWFVRFSVYTLRALSFETEDILRYVKSGFVRDGRGSVINSIRFIYDNGSDPSGVYDNDIADRLERLCREYDLRRRDWLKPFPAELDASGQLEELRGSVTEPLLGLLEAVGAESITNKVSGREMTRELCRFMFDRDRQNISVTVKGKCIRGMSEDGKRVYDNAMLNDYSELWDDLITVFESAYKAFGDQTVTIAEYTSILSDILTSTTVSKPPQTLDAVTIGDPRRSRFSDVRHLFICGFSRGVMPPPSPVSEVFTPAESEILARNDIPAASDRLSRYSLEQFTVYRCINIPSERLYITYPLMSENAAVLEPSPALASVTELYPDTVIEGADSFGAEHYCRTLSSAERYLAHIYSDKSRTGERKKLKALIKQKDARFVEILRSAAGEKPDSDRHSVPAEKEKRLITLTSWSPSAFGQLNKCKFAFFCKYGLGLREDNERTISTALVGNVIHRCLQDLLMPYLGNKTGLAALTKQDIKDRVEESIRRYEKETFFEDFGGSLRFSYLMHRLGSYAVSAAERIQLELSKSAFCPEALEKDISFALGGITVAGKCDRIDSYTDESGTRFVRVIDYKHSSRHFSIGDINKGVNIQTLLYLFSECAAPASKPSSMLYVPVGTMSYMTTDGNDTETRRNESRQEHYSGHAPEGLILSDSPENTENAALNASINALLGSKRKTYISPLAITPAEYGAIYSYMESYIGAKVREMTAGMASACPSSEDDCKYCSFTGFCGRR